MVNVTRFTAQVGQTMGGRAARLPPLAMMLTRRSLPASPPVRLQGVNAFYGAGNLIYVGAGGIMSTIR